MYGSYDGCSDELFESGTTLLQVYPPDDNALTEVKKFIAEYCLTRDEVRIMRNKNGIFLITKTDVTLTTLYKGDLYDV